MKFEKGKPKTGGRKPGAKNKTPKEFKEAIKHLVESNLGNMEEWIQGIEEPSKKIEIILKLAEYSFPKLGRIEPDQPGNQRPIFKVLGNVGLTPEYREKLFRGEYTSPDNNENN